MVSASLITGAMRAIMRQVRIARRRLRGTRARVIRSATAAIGTLIIVSTTCASGGTVTAAAAAITSTTARESATEMTRENDATSVIAGAAEIMTTVDVPVHETVGASAARNAARGRKRSHLHLINLLLLLRLLAPRKRSRRATRTSLRKGYQAGGELAL